MLGILIDHKLQWSKKGLNCKPLTCNPHDLVGLITALNVRGSQFKPCCDHWNLCSIKISSTKHHRSFKLNSKLKYFKWVYWFPWNCLLGTGIRYEDICLLHTTLKFRYAFLSVYLQILSFCNFGIQKTERLKEVANIIPQILMSELLSNKIFVIRFLNTASVSFFVSRYPFSGFIGKTELIKTI